MNTIQLPDDSQLRQVITHYQKFYFPMGIILVCIGLFIWFIFPQIQVYTDQKAQNDEVQGRITSLKRNIALLSTISDSDQTSQLQTVISALPQDKDYAGILYAVRNASVNSGVGIGDFSFTVGELSGKNVITKNTPYISMKLDLKGSPNLVSKFLTELAQTLPLSNISDIQLSSTNTTLVIYFYYKPVPQLRVNYSQPLVSLTGESQSLLQKLQGWHTYQPTFDLSQSIDSSESAQQGFGE